jgi:NADH-quinone oxidoreductase subunit C
MNQESIRDKLQSAFGEDVIQAAIMYRGQLSLTLDKTAVLKVGRYLRTEPDLAFDYLSFVGGVDRLPRQPRFEVVYQLYSTRHKHRLRLKALLDETDGALPTIDSVHEIWRTADWHERETAEMFGIEFTGHPDPRKLLLPDEWTVYPLRKDFPLLGTEEDTPDLPGAP